ncbi:AraC family transcriptional regulator [uncultured Shimia sp.]|uniref:AraC family transcriptional regulator n=1 Tax=uncultured Shimia sp. TaxID=573152 RepID=UPI002620BE81|nr:AraC family transcriptional regulator [uncultured Shimia sp.]
MLPHAFDASAIVFNETPVDLNLWPYDVPAAGRTLVQADHGMVRQNYHEHVLILTLQGTGRIEVGKAQFEARPGDLAWIDTALSYAHGAGYETDWGYHWMAISGHGLHALHHLLGFDEVPVASGCGDLVPVFESVFARLSRSDGGKAALLNSLVPRVLEKAFLVRGREQPVNQTTAVRRVTQRVRAELHRPWDIAELADISGLSQSQLFRRFKAETGNSPIGWLRKERIVLACYLLRTTALSIAQVALQCGYLDPFHFSRDFKRLQGRAPRAFRAQFRKEG